MRLRLLFGFVNLTVFKFCPWLGFPFDFFGDFSWDFIADAGCFLFDILPCLEGLGAGILRPPKDFC